MGDQIEVKVRCAKCSSNNLVTDDEPTDLSIVRCRDCGNEVGTWSAYQAAAGAAVLKSYKKSLQSAFGQALQGNKHVKFTASSDESGDVEDE
jgi:DNA-directed RNA polymerase subunit RPC12/RpoP